MKKILVATCIVGAGMMMAACGKSNADNSKTTSSLKADNASLKTEVKSLKAQIKTSDSDSETSTAEKNENKTENANAVIGKEVVFKDGKGKKLAGVTLVSVNRNWSSFAAEEMSDGEEDFTNGKPDNIVQISVKYTNYGIDETWSPSFDVYDGTGTKAEDNGYADGGDDVSIGHSTTENFWVSLSVPYAKNDKTEIEFSDYLGSDDHEYKAKWVVEQ